jgi:hypothetical protein
MISKLFVEHVNKSSVEIEHIYHKKAKQSSNILTSIQNTKSQKRQKDKRIIRFGQ